MAESSNIKVAVRVRPFTSREIMLGAECIIAMQGQTTTMLPSKQSRFGHESKHFTYDFSYWSLDPNAPHFAMQERVMEDLAGAILRNALDGFNGCLFAYGQTGSGKTFSVLGLPESPGMVPWTVEHLFAERDKLHQDPNVELNVWMSYLEIYNDRIHDLISPSQDEKGNLNVMDHPKLGVYVPNLTEVACHSPDDVTNLLNFGTKRRAVAATRMNDMSSRSHAVFCLRTERADGPPPRGNEQDTRHILKAKINLIDLAGSERVAKTGAEGNTLKEGNCINKSLSVLGMVIKELCESHAKALQKQRSALAASDTNAGKRDAVPAHGAVPFRASKLTFLLRDSLAGNSKTFMLAAISPAADSHDETLSTLRFASSVKSIKTCAVQNRDKKDVLIDELKKELEELRKQMALAARNASSPAFRSRLASVDSSPGDLLTAHIQEQERYIRKLQAKREEQMEEKLQIRSAHDSAFRDMGLSQDVLKTTFGVNEATPYLLNMAEDPFLAGSLLYYLPKDRAVTIGADKENTIPLSGIGIVDNLCEIMNFGDEKLTIAKCGKAGRVVAGGKLLAEGTLRELKHGEKLFFGRAHAFKVCVPHQADAGKLHVQRHASETLLMEGSFEDECAVIEDSPSWDNLRPILDQICPSLSAADQRRLMDEVKTVIKYCEEANEIACQCKNGEDLHCKADLTSTTPVSVVVCVTRGDSPQPLHIWSMAEMAERLERMRVHADIFLHENTELDPLDDPWSQVPHRDIVDHVSRLRTALEETLDENLSLKHKSEQAKARSLLIWQHGRSESMLWLCFDLWHKVSKTRKKAMDFVSWHLSKESKENSGQTSRAASRQDLLSRQASQKEGLSRQTSRQATVLTLQTSRSISAPIVDNSVNPEWTVESTNGHGASTPTVQGDLGHTAVVETTERVSSETPTGTMFGAEPKEDERKEKPPVSSKPHRKVKAPRVDCATMTDARPEFSLPLQQAAYPSSVPAARLITTGRGSPAAPSQTPRNVGHIIRYASTVSTSAWPQEECRRTPSVSSTCPGGSVRSCHAAAQVVRPVAQTVSLALYDSNPSTAGGYYHASTQARCPSRSSRHSEPGTTTPRVPSAQRRISYPSVVYSGLGQSVVVTRSGAATPRVPTVQNPAMWWKVAAGTSRPTSPITTRTTSPLAARATSPTITRTTSPRMSQGPVRLQREVRSHQASVLDFNDSTGVVLPASVTLREPQVTPGTGTRIVAPPCSPGTEASPGGSLESAPTIKFPGAEPRFRSTRV